MGDFPIFAMGRLLKNATGKRVSSEAKSALQKTIKKKLETITLLASELCAHAGRSTIKKEDILLSKES